MSDSGVGLVGFGFGRVLVLVGGGRALGQELHRAIAFTEIR